MQSNTPITKRKKFHKNIMWIVDLRKESGEEVIDVIIPEWSPTKTVQLPVSLIGNWILDFQPAIGTYLIANVNNGAEHSEDLHFTHFQIAPEPENC